MNLRAQRPRYVPDLLDQTIIECKLCVVAWAPTKGIGLPDVA